MATNNVNRDLNRMAPPSFSGDLQQWATLSQQLADLTRVNQQQVDGQRNSLPVQNNRVNAESARSDDSVLQSGLERLGTSLLRGLTLYPLFSGIRNLFGGGQTSEPQPLPLFQLPTPVRAEAGLTNDGQLVNIDRGIGDRVRQLSARNEDVVTNRMDASAAPMAITLNINALDSRSILDRSDDIARAVRDAMLHSHAINDVVGEL